ncbi:MAG TPA: MATE family efflux transporter [Aliidongia sp.]|nr:MATE family efflux transporter [Aliidongia sp.]
MPSPAVRPGLIDADVPFWRTLLRFLVPLMASNILQALSATIGNIYLGRFIGVSAIAAASSFFPFLFFLISFLIGISNASTVLIGQAFGAGLPERVREVAGTTITVNILLGAALAALGGIFAPTVLAAVHTPADILASATEYARILLYAMPLLFLYLLYTTFLRGTGDSATPFYSLIFNCAIALLVMPVLITGQIGIPGFEMSLGGRHVAIPSFGFATGLPGLGLNGSAYTSIIANLLTLVGLGAYLLRRRHPLAPDWALLSHLAIDWPILRTLIRIGIPTATQMVLISLSEIAVLSFVNDYGSDATAAYGAVNQVVSYVQFPAISVGIAASIFGAQAIGRGEQGRLGEITRTALLLNLLIVLTLIAIVYGFGRNILGWFLTDPHTLALAYRLLGITLWSYVLFGMTAVLSGIMRSSGTVFWPTAISIFAIWGVEVPAAWGLSRWIGIDGIWIAYPIAFAAGLAMQASYFLLVWRHRRFSRLI